MRILILFLSLISMMGCSQIILEPADFSWPIESVLNVDDKGFVAEERYSFSTNVIPLFFAEKNDSTSFKNETVRIIRDINGLYFMVANEFKNVYVFSADNGTFSLRNTILITEFGLDLPAFNQRKPYIEILDGEQHVAYLTPDGIRGEE